VTGVSQAAASRKPALQIKYQSAAIHAGLLSLIMVTLGAAFLSTAQMSGSILQTISALFIYKPDLAQPPSYGMAGMFLAVLLLGGALLQLGDDSLNGRKPGWVNLALALVCALLLSLLTWVARASQLVGIQQAMLRQGNLESVFAGLPAMLMLSLAALLVISLGLAWIMGSSDTFTPFSFTWPAASGVALVILVAGLLINFFSLRPMQANVLYVQVLRQVEAHDYGTALKLYDQVVQLSPSDSDHLRYAANLYGETINTLPDPAQKERFFQAGLKYVQKAAALEPLSIDNTMALARFYRLGGDFSPDPAQKNARFFMANTYFAQALKGFPARIDFWLEWAEFQALAGDIQGAFDKAGAALAVDETYAPTYQLIGDLHAVYADSLSDPAVRSASFNKAQQAYQKQADLLVNQKANAAQAFFNIAKIDESLGQYPQAYQAYTLAAQQNMGDLQWQIYKRLADVSAKLKDAAGQRQYLQKALESAPKPEQPALQAELNALTP
jgi:tetratricopeptide (TPR) repeat protein